MNEYLDAAMQTARFDQLTNRGWFGALPQFHIVMPAAESRQDCSWARRDDLKAAVREALQRGRPLPVIVGVETPTLEQTAYWSAGGQSARRRAPGQPKGHDR